MIDFNLDENCYGCGACSSICPMDAIKMTFNKEGFLMPEVDAAKCISCGQCDKVCISYTKGGQLGREKEAFLYVNPDPKVLGNSASGGAFGALAKLVLNMGGFVCGCVFNENMRAVHIVSNRWEDIVRMQGSKYVQSDISECYDTIKMLLSKGLVVLFSGTPCQCEAVKKVLKNKNGNEYLYTVAVICHGVPSPKVWELWKNQIEMEEHSHLLYANHRAKGKCYNLPESLYKFANGKVIKMATYLEDLYCFAFSTDVFLRNTCYHCHFKGDNVTADVIIGDYFDFANPDRHKDGVSVLIVNTDKAHYMFDNMTQSLEKIALKDIIKNNGALIQSVPYNSKRTQFFDDLEIYGIAAAIKRNIPIQKFYIKRLLYKIRLFDKIKKLKGR